jgi:macrolide transport system ATP-binding/permease protein
MKKRVGLHLWLIRFVGLIVPRRLRADWRQEWEAELQWRQRQLVEWGRLDVRGRLALWWHGAGALADAFWLQPKRWEDEVVQDIRFAVRMLCKSPGYTAVAVLALALGIGVNAAVLSAVNGFVLRPLPVEKPHELIAPHWGGKADAEVWGRFSYPNYEDLRARNDSLAGLCAWTGVSAAISAGSSGESRAAGDELRAEVGWGELVSSNYFEVMGVKPLLGRGFLPEEERAPNAHAVVVLGEVFWQRRFNADTAIVGETIYLNGAPFTVVGVMPESFLGAEFYLRKAFWAPLMMAEKFGRPPDWKTNRAYTPIQLFGRLKPGMTMARAEADLNLVAGALAKLHPRENADARIQIVTELDGRYADSTRLLKYGGLLALCVAVLVLLLACANVANLMLARGAARTREIGIRMAIGAGRGRIVRQMLTESLLLACVGGVLGWLLAWPGANAVQALFPPVPYPVSFDFAPDGDVLWWMLAASVATGVLSGLAPALLAARTDLVGVINGGAARSARRRRWNLSGALVVAQVTISIIVLVCAGLFMRSLRQAVKTDPGFNPEHLVTMMINPSLLGYDVDASRRFFRELQHRLEAQPGVRAAAAVNEMPLMVQQLTRGPIVKEGEVDPPPNRGVSVDSSLVTPKYFDTLQTALVRGRDFTDRDDATAPPVAIVNQEFARRFYGGEAQSLGQRFRFAQGAPLMEIVGVVRDSRYGTLYETQQMHLFLPVHQQAHTALTLAVRATSSAALPAVVERARREIAGLDARMPAYGVMMAEDNLSLAYLGPRVAAGVATTFGVLALLLATIGLYSVMTHNVSQRRHEIGIRMALGASLREVLRLVIRQGMRLVWIGLALGLLGALALTRVLASLLLGVGATDPLTYAGVAGMLSAVAWLACYLPARRAARVDPLASLRRES